MNGERRRDASRRRTGTWRHDKTHKRVQKRNCSLVDTRPVYYLLAGYERRGGGVNG